MDEDWGDEPVVKKEEVKFALPEPGQDWTMEHALNFFISQGYKDEVELVKGKNIDLSKLENYTNITPQVLLAMKLGVSFLELIKSTRKAAEGSSGAGGNRISAGANLDSGWGSSSNNGDRPRGGGRGRGGRGGRGGGGGSCFKCNEAGHFARECPNSDSNDGGRGGGRGGSRGGIGGFGGGGGRGGNRSSFNNSFSSNNAADEDWGSSSSTVKTNPADDNWDDPPSTNRGNTFGGGRGRGGKDRNRSFGNSSFGGGSAANEDWGGGGGGNSKTNNPAEDNWDDPPPTKRGDSAAGSRGRGRSVDGSSFRGAGRNNAAADDDWGSDIGTTANNDNWGNNPSPSSNSTRGRRGDGGGGRGGGVRGRSSGFGSRNNSFTAADEDWGTDVGNKPAKANDGDDWDAVSATATKVGSRGGQQRGGHQSTSSDVNIMDDDWGVNSNSKGKSTNEDDWGDTPAPKPNLDPRIRNRNNSAQVTKSAVKNDWATAPAIPKKDSVLDDDWGDAPVQVTNTSSAPNKTTEKTDDWDCSSNPTKTNADDDWGANPSNESAGGKGNDKKEYKNRSIAGVSVDMDDWTKPKTPMPHKAPNSNTKRDFGTRGRDRNNKGFRNCTRNSGNVALDEWNSNTDEPLDPNLSLDEIIRKENSKDRREGGWRYYSGHSGGERRSLGSRSESIADCDEWESEADTVVKSTPERTVSTAGKDKETLEGGKQNLIIKRFMEIANMDSGDATSGTGTALPPKVDTSDNTQSTSTGKRTNDDDNDWNDAPPAKRHRHQEENILLPSSEACADGNLVKETDELTHQAESTFSSTDGLNEDSLIIDETNPSSDTTKTIQTSPAKA